MSFVIDRAAAFINHYLTENNIFNQKGGYFDFRTLVDRQ